MTKRPVFSAGEAGRAYRNIMAASNKWTAAGRKLTEELWEEFEPYADREFLEELRFNFDQRFWEMYLSIALLRSGYEISCPKPGPDVGIAVEGKRIWFEAVCPTRGADGSPDQVPEVKYDGQVYSVPNDKIILRYLNSISEKYERQRPNWLERGIVSQEDAFVVAMNPRSLGHDSSDTVPPRILQAAFPIGHAFVKINRETLRTGYEFRPKLPKASGSLVDTGVFLHEVYAGLSGLLLSRIDVVNGAKPLGQDFELLPNPVAAVALPDHLKLPGRRYVVATTDDGYRVTIPQVGSASSEH